MTKQLILSTLLFFIITGLYAQNLKNNYLLNEFQNKGASSSIEIDYWKLNKLKTIQDNINQLPEDLKLTLIDKANVVSKTEWPSLKVTDYLLYKNTGNLSAYGGTSFNRRKKLTQLIVGELVENKGRFMPEIVNGLWLTLEESTWTLPQHISLQKAGEGLPDPNEQILALRSGDISALVAWIRFLFYDKLNSISPMLISRIDYELDRRVIAPFLERDDFHWMGFNNRRVNNWNIWINTNVLFTAVLAVENKEKRNRIIEKTIRSSDNFLNNYPEDGGVDEGVGYWGHAAGRLIQFVELLTSISNNKLDWSNNQLIHNIGSYIYKMHIDGNHFVNFADASAIINPSIADIYTYGKVFNDKQLRQFAAYLSLLENKNAINDPYADLNIFIKRLETAPLIRKELPIAPAVKESFLPNLQVITARQKKDNTGLFFAAKGGHNNESHNHNDIGNFVLYMNGKPVIIDAGVGVYTKQTFSKNRYKIWSMQSQWHNCPTINGYDQKNGQQYKATDVVFNSKNDKLSFSLDIGSAYPKDAEIIHWKREFVFSGKKGILSIKENYSLKEWKAPSSLNFMTGLEVKQKSGLLQLGKDENAIFVEYDPKLFNVTTEDKVIKDSKMSKIWGNKLTRIVFKSKENKVNGFHEIVFKASSKN